MSVYGRHSMSILPYRVNFWRRDCHARAAFVDEICIYARMESFCRQVYSSLTAGWAVGGAASLARRRAREGTKGWMKASLS